MIEGQKRNKQQSLSEKELQSEIPKQYSEEDSGWLKCNTDLRKTSSIFITGANGRNKSMEIRGLVECDKCRLCWEQRETVYHLSSGCKKLAGTEYVKRHSNALKVLVIEKDGMKLFWDWEHPMRTDGIARRPDLTLEDT